MSHREKVERFLDEMSRRGVMKSTAAPPAWRAMWAIGLKAPPPHFLSFFTLAWTLGLSFGVLWGLAMGLTVWRAQSWTLSAAAGLAAGVLFGPVLAAYYRHSAAKLGLPAWERYPGD